MADKAKQKRRVAVLGAGIIGLSTAICLQEADPSLDITIIAEKFSPDLTSDGAAGFWEPLFTQNTPMEKLERWGKITFDYLRKILETEKAAQLQMHYISGYTLSDTKMEDLLFKDIFLRAIRLSEKELEEFPKDFVDGYFHTSIMFPGTPYMEFITKQFERNGGKMVHGKVKSFSELVGKFDIIVNCTGLGSYELCNDTALTPIRGQVLKLKAPWLKHFYVISRKEDLKKGKPCYIFPRTTEVIVGGTTQLGNWSTEINERDTDCIMEKVSEFEPTLKNAELLDTFVGLRPARTTVRLEKEEMKVNTNYGSETTLQVVHNYGHGGGGLSLFWGCAQDARDLVLLSLLQSNL